MQGHGEVHNGEGVGSEGENSGEWMGSGLQAKKRLSGNCSALHGLNFKPMFHTPRAMFHLS